MPFILQSSNKSSKQSTIKLIFKGLDFDSFYIPRNKDNGLNMALAFVYFADTKAAQQALETKLPYIRIYRGGKEAQGIAHFEEARNPPKKAN